jgi:hypothetical protein
MLSCIRHPPPAAHPPARSARRRCDLRVRAARRGRLVDHYNEAQGSAASHDEEILCEMSTKLRGESVIWCAIAAGRRIPCRLGFTECGTGIPHSLLLSHVA